MRGTQNILDIAREGLQAEHALEALPIELDEYDPEFVATASELESVVANSVHLVAGLPATNWCEAQRFGAERSQWPPLSTANIQSV